MRFVMVSLVLGMLLSTVALAQDTVTTSVSNADYLRWLGQRDQLWSQELFALEVSGDPSSKKLTATRGAIEKQKSVLRNAPDERAGKERQALQNLVQTFEQGLEEAFSGEPSESQFYTKL